MGVVKDRGRVKVQLTKPFGYRDVALDVEGQRIEGSFINTGVPHFVAVVKNLDGLDVK